MRTPRSNAVLRQAPIEGAKVLSVKFAAEDVARLKTLALREDTSVSELIRVAVARLLDDDAAPKTPTAPPTPEAKRAPWTRPDPSRIKNHF